MATIICSFSAQAWIKTVFSSPVDLNPRCGRRANGGEGGALGLLRVLPCIRREPWTSVIHPYDAGTERYAGFPPAETALRKYRQALV